jgi:hypothetical protein
MVPMNPRGALPRRNSCVDVSDAVWWTVMPDLVEQRPDKVKTNARMLLE